MARFPVPAPQFNGQHRRVELGNAFEWLKQGWALFVAWPGQWLALTVVLLVLQMGISIVPLVGSLAASSLRQVLMRLARVAINAWVGVSACWA